MPTKLQGTIQHIFPGLAPGPAQGFLGVLRVQTKGKVSDIRIIGQTDYAPRGNAEVEIMGDTVIHPRYGSQFMFTYLRPTCNPQSPSSLANFLVLHCPGFHRQRALQLVKQHGPSLLDLIVSQPNILREAGLDEGEITDTLAFLARYGSTQADSLSLAGLPFPVVQQAKILFGQAHACTLLAECPYGFLAAGATPAVLAALFPHHKRDVADQWQLIMAHLHNTGSTAFRRLPAGLTPSNVRDLLRWRLLLKHQGNYTPVTFATKEQFIASWLRGSCSQIPVTPPTRSWPTLNPEQARAATLMLHASVFVLSGGPGTGKTHLLGQILPQLAAQQPVGLLAPTGKAAKRLGDLAGVEALTIHRFLYRNRALLDLPPDHKRLHLPGLVIIDEFSMVDTELFFDLLQLLPPGTRLLLVGDADQLPSITPGNLLRDLLPLLPHQVLTQNMRQVAGDLVATNAHKINTGDAKLDLGPNFAVVAEEDSDKLRLALQEQLSQVQAQGRMQDVQVLCPTYQGTLGIDQLNPWLGNLLNPHAAGWAAGDRVVVNANRYRLGVVNGDAGTVLHTVGGVTVDFGGWQVMFNKADQSVLTLAWALSSHKAQGSEYPIVFICLHPSMPPLLLSRALLYTAVTRARERVIIFGPWASIRACVSNTKADHRRTLLPNYLATGTSKAGRKIRA